MVQQHQVEIAFAHEVVGFLDGAALGDVDAFFAQVLRNLFAEEFLLGDHDDFLDGHKLRLFFVHLRDEVGVLALGGGEMICGHEFVAEEELFVFAIE